MVAHAASYKFYLEHTLHNFNVFRLLLTKEAHFKQNDSCAERFDANFEQLENCARCFVQVLAF